MPSPTGKGKVPIDQVKEYDPNLQGSLGKGREKHQKAKTSNSMVKKSKHVVS